MDIVTNDGKNVMQINDKKITLYCYHAKKNIMFLSVCDIIS